MILSWGRKSRPCTTHGSRLLNVLSHTLWFLPKVASCYAMANLLSQKQNRFYHDYTVNVCAGAKAGIGAAALAPVRESMSDPLGSKTITLSCGKLTTGVTVKPRTGIFMLRNLSSLKRRTFRLRSVCKAASTSWTLTSLCLLRQPQTRRTPRCSKPSAQMNGVGRSV